MNALSKNGAAARVLVVDDEPDNREALKSILVGRGLEVAAARDGEDGFQQIQAFQPDAVLCDVRMPNGDGLTLLKRARDARYDGVFVMMTACGKVEEAVEAMRLGAESYVTTPLPAAVLDLLDLLDRTKRLPRRDFVPGPTLAQIEREAILRTVEFVGGSPLKAAALLGISVRKVQYRLKEYAAAAAN